MQSTLPLVNLGREFADFAFARIGFDAGGDTGGGEEDVVTEWLGLSWPRDGINGIQLGMAEFGGDGSVNNGDAVRGNIALSELHIT